MRTTSALIGAVSFVAIVASATAPAGACGCGEIHGPRVAAGQSPSGERWSVKAAREPKRYITFETSVAGQPDTGGFTSIPGRRMRGPCRAALETAGYESGWGEVRGPVDRSVVWIDLRLRDGRHLGTAPRLLRSRRKHRWLRGFRWTSVFLPRGSEAIRARAFDSRGRVVTRMRSHGGLFDCRR